MRFNFRFHLLLCGILVAASSVQGLAQAGRSAPPSQPSSPFPSVAYDERAWKPFESIEGGFTVAFPGKPGFETQTVETAASPLVNRIHGLAIGVAFFVASYTDMPSAVPSSDKEWVNNALDSGRDRMLAGAGGKIISESPLTLQGYTGRYILYSDRDGLMHTQSYFAGNRLYQLFVLTEDYRSSPAEDQKFYKDIVNRFFTSFKLDRKTY